MNRLTDYLGFSVRFAGLGYIALWPVSTPADGDVFGASYLCRGALNLICGLPHPLQLGIGLHAAGALCAVAATLHLLAGGVLRVRRRRAPAAGAPPEPPAKAATSPAPRLRPNRRPMPPPRKITEPRSHFGLRGVP